MKSNFDVSLVVLGVAGLYPVFVPDELPAQVRLVPRAAFQVDLRSSSQRDG